MINASIIKSLATVFTPLVLKAFRFIQENAIEDGSKETDIGVRTPGITAKDEHSEKKVLHSEKPKEIPISVSWPVKRIPIRVTSRYGWRTLPNGVKGFHMGVDFQTWDSSKEVVAVEDSYVTKIVQMDKKYPERFKYNSKTKQWDEIAPKGRAWTPYVELVGIYSKNKYKYKHVQSRVFVGQKLSAGDVIGVAGNFGYSMGEHLHFEVYDYIEKTGLYSNAIDGLKYLKQVLKLGGDVQFGKTTVPEIKSEV